MCSSDLKPLRYQTDVSSDYLNTRPDTVIHMNYSSQFTQKSYFGTTQANTTQATNTQNHNRYSDINYDDLDFMFDSRSKMSSVSHSSIPMDIETQYELPSNHVCHMPTMIDYGNEALVDNRCEADIDSDILDMMDGDMESSRMMEEDINYDQDEDIDLIFPDLADDPRFQFPSFTKKQPQQVSISISAPFENQIHGQHHSLANLQPLPYNSSYYQQSVNYHSLAHRNPVSTYIQTPAYQHQLAVKSEHDASYQNIFKFRQAGTGIDLSYSDPLATAHKKIFMFYRHMFEVVCTVKTLHMAIGHISVSMKLSKDDVKRCTGVDKSSMTLRSGRRFLAACLSKIVLAVNAMHGPVKDKVWHILSTCC